MFPSSVLVVSRTLSFVLVVLYGTYFLLVTDKFSVCSKWNFLPVGGWVTGVWSPMWCNHLCLKFKDLLMITTEINSKMHMQSFQQSRNGRDSPNILVCHSVPVLQLAYSMSRPGGEEAETVATGYFYIAPRPIELYYKLTLHCMHGCLCHILT